MPGAASDEALDDGADDPIRRHLATPLSNNMPCFKVAGTAVAGFDLVAVRLAEIEAKRPGEP